MSVLLHSPMRRTLSYGAFMIVLLAATGCSRASVPDVDTPAVSSSSESSESIQNDPSDDVSYEGMLQPAGTSLYMEGTHRLYPDNESKVILLQSDTINLEAYVGTHVRVTGDERPTVEVGGTLLDVQEVAELLDESSSEAASSEMSAAASSADESSSEAMQSSSAVAQSSARAVSSARASSAAQKSSVSAVSSSPSSAPASTNQANVDSMAKETVTAASFTQQYCTGHVGFCIPVHRNWYYTSFGATSTYLWHVEVSSQEIKSLGDGPLSINFLSGDVPSSGSDGQVVEYGTSVIGFRAWTNNRHFEIIAPAKLRAAVEFMTSNLSVYQVDSAEGASSLGASSSH